MPAVPSHAAAVTGHRAGSPPRLTPAGFADGAVYALGGMGADTSPQALVRVYEPAKDHWQPLPSMPTPCYGASAFLQGNKIFLLGRWASQAPLRAAPVDGGGFPPQPPAHPKLTPCRPCPGTAAGHCWWCRLPLGVPAASASRPCAGGRQGKLPVTSFEAFDLETRSWTRYPSVPSRRAFAACAAADGVFFSLGGLQQPGPHNFYSRPHFVNTVEMFDPVQGEPRRPGWGLQRGVWGAMLTASALQVPGASPAAPSA